LPRPTHALGFESRTAANDPFAAAARPETREPDGAGADGCPEATRGAGPAAAPVGWLAVVDGPGRGTTFELKEGVSTIGRGADQTVRLDLGDPSVSRDTHAAIAYHAAGRRFFVGHAGKANLVRLNGRPVLSTEPLSAGDTIRIGRTMLRFVPLCGPDFAWSDGPASDGACPDGSASGAFGGDDGRKGAVPTDGGAPRDGAWSRGGRRPGAPAMEGFP